jgi:DNA-binding NarL/FixJ family response regulator
MNRTELKKLYIDLTMHPKFDGLPEKYQDILTYFAAGFTSREVSEAVGLAPRSASTTRHSIFKRMGFIVYENGKTRAMHSEEVKNKLNL